MGLRGCEAAVQQYSLSDARQAKPLVPESHVSPVPVRGSLWHWGLAKICLGRGSALPQAVGQNARGKIKQETETGQSIEAEHVTEYGIAPNSWPRARTMRTLSFGNAAVTVASNQQYRKAVTDSEIDKAMSTWSSQQYFRGSVCWQGEKCWRASEAWCWSLGAVDPFSHYRPIGP